MALGVVYLFNFCLFVILMSRTPFFKDIYIYFLVEFIYSYVNSETPSNHEHETLDNI